MDKPRTSSKKRTPRKVAPAKRTPPSHNGMRLLLVGLVTSTIVIFALPVLLGLIGLPLLWPWIALAIFAVTVIGACFLGRQCDTALLISTLLLLGLGCVEQIRLGNWSMSGIIAMGVGCAFFLISMGTISMKTLAVLLPKLRWVCWLGAVGIMGALLVVGHRYRGGMFLPGNINPSELIKFLLVICLAGWLPKHKDGFNRYLFGCIPLPQLRETLELGILWGVPLFGAILVGDLGLVLILCLSLMLMLMVATRKVIWLILGIGGAALAGWLVQFISVHSRVRFAMWHYPFSDPLGKGWQILQALCAEYAGGLWGVGLGEGQPELTPIVGSDFVYAAIAEEWGLVGCALLLLLFWVWLLHVSLAGAQHKDEGLQLLGAGMSCMLGTQILLNIGGVIKALPMTGITLPFFSQGGCSLLTVLLMSGLLIAMSRQSTTGK